MAPTITDSPADGAGGRRSQHRAAAASPASFRRGHRRARSSDGGCRSSRMLSRQPPIRSQRESGSGADLTPGSAGSHSCWCWQPSSRSASRCWRFPVKHGSKQNVTTDAVTPLPDGLSHTPIAPARLIVESQRAFANEPLAFGSFARCRVRGRNGDAGRPGQGNPAVGRHAARLDRLAGVRARTRQGLRPCAEGFRRRHGCGDRPAVAP